MTNVPPEGESLSQFYAPINPLTLPLPLDWTLLQFRFGQLVERTEGRSKIIGLEYIHESKPAAVKLGAGW